MANQWIKIGNISGGGAYLGLPAKKDNLQIARDVTPQYFIHSIHAKDAFISKNKPGGNITMPLLAKDGVGEILYAFFGQVQTSGSGPYTHTFTAKEKDLPELTIIKNVGTIQEKYTGVKVKSIKVKSPADGEMELTIDFVAKDGELTSGETEGPYDHSKTILITGASVTWGGTAFQVGNVDLTLERDLDEGGFALNGDAGRSMIPEGNFKAEAEIDVLADDITFAQDFATGATKEFMLKLQTKDGHTIEFHLPKAIVASRGKATDVDKGVLIEKVKLIGLDDGTHGSAYVVLTNDVASYPRT